LGTWYFSPFWIINRPFHGILKIVINKSYPIVVAHKTDTMKNINKLIFLITISIIISCGQTDPNKQIDEGKVEGETYTSKEIGWTMQIPKNWSIISKDKMDKSTERGMEAVKEVGGEFDYSGLKHLVSFQKNQFNIFQSTSEPFELEYEGEWEDNNAGLKELLYATYANQGIKIDTSSSNTKIDELNFEVFHITIYGTNGDIILYQDMYGRYINGFDFGVNINYNNEKDKETMMNVWRNSKFKKQQ